MSKKYKHLRVEGRKKLYGLLVTSHPISQIAKKLGFHKAAIYLELSRNSHSLG